MGPILSGPCRETVGLGSLDDIVWAIDCLVPNKAITIIGEWLICGAGRLEIFYCLHIMKIYTLFK